MIRLDEWDLNLIRRIEKKNYKDYKVRTIEGEDYIRKDDLISLIEDLEDNRDYAEEKIVDMANQIDEIKHERMGGLEWGKSKKLERLIKENEELKQKIERIESTLNEDDYDRLAMEGVEL